jgi:L-histidine Nalpha-methyltransferase
VRCPIPPTLAHPRPREADTLHIERLSSAPSPLEFARGVAAGLSDVPRWLPSRFLYDARGSALFEEICELPEYYPTRTESAILAAHARDVAQITGPVTLLELGSGSAVKTDHLLRAYAARAARTDYVSVDVSEAALADAARRIVTQHPAVRVTGVVGRYEEAFRLFDRHSPCLVLFLGSTIGNLNHAESVVFWERVARHLAPGDFFLLGVDLVKDAGVLERAYNDAAGVSARFTRNVFRRMNDELDAGLDLDAIEHVARYNTAWQRIEISARFRAAQTVRIAPLGTSVAIGAGEMVMTEVSRKFEVERLRAYLACFGLVTRAVYTDPRRWFGVLLLQRGEAQ